MTHHHAREPIGHTCPDIDKYQRSIKSILYRDSVIRKMEPDELMDAAISMADELRDCIEYLEKLRASNDELRRWGIDEADRVDELEKEIQQTG
jgi:uncharacterized coiled-coil DUF342 family protein